MSVPIASLGKEGFTHDIDRKIDYLMCCYFFSKHSQSTLYRKGIVSLSKDIQQHGNNEYNFREAVENSLKVFLTKYFTTTSVDVRIIDNGDEPGIKLQIEAIVSDGDSITPNSVSVGYSLLTRDSALKTIINLIDETTLYQS